MGTMDLQTDALRGEFNRAAATLTVAPQELLVAHARSVSERRAEQRPAGDARVNHTSAAEFKREWRNLRQQARADSRMERGQPCPRNICSSFTFARTKLSALLPYVGFPGRPAPCSFGALCKSPRCVVPAFCWSALLAHSAGTPSRPAQKLLAPDAWPSGFSKSSS